MSRRAKDSPVETLRELAAVNRGISNMEFILVFRRRKRDRLIDELRRHLGRHLPRTLALRSATAIPGPGACVLCGGALEQASGIEIQVALSSDGRLLAIHPGDEALIEAGVLEMPIGFGQRAWLRAHRACASGIDEAWWREPRPTLDMEGNPTTGGGKA